MTKTATTTITTVTPAKINRQYLISQHITSTFQRLHFDPVRITDLRQESNGSDLSLLRKQSDVKCCLVHIHHHQPAVATGRRLRQNSFHRQGKKLSVAQFQPQWSFLQGNRHKNSLTMFKKKVQHFFFFLIAGFLL